MTRVSPKRDFNRRLGRVVKLLGKAHGVPMTRLAADLGMSYTALNARLAGDTDWSALEVARIAEYFEIEPAVFFDDPVLLVSAHPRRSSERSPSAGSGWFPRRSACTPSQFAEAA